MTDHHARQPSDDERVALFLLHATHDAVLAELVTLTHEICERVSRIEALEHRLDELEQIRMRWISPALRWTVTSDASPYAGRLSDTWALVTRATPKTAPSSPAATTSGTKRPTVTTTTS